jgi:hypothetical protein
MPPDIFAKCRLVVATSLPRHGLEELAIYCVWLIWLNARKPLLMMARGRYVRSTKRRYAILRLSMPPVIAL